MDKKKIIIIVAIIAVIAIIGAYFVFNDSHVGTAKQKTILLSKSAYMQVPDTKNVTNKVDKDGVFHYKNKDSDINITSCSNLSAASSEKELKKLKNDVATGAKKLKEDNVVIYEKDGVYSVFVKNTQYNDTLLIQSSDKNLLLQCWESVKYHDPSVKIKINDTGSSPGSGNVIDVVEKTQSAVQSSSSSTSSSSSSSSDYSSGGYSDFGFSSSSSSSRGSSSKASGSGKGGYSDFGFD
ncbi:hypothetical protein [Methanobrevibacter sp.]|uniref:hypothetical protein n=1 Tax=Methanobrevibacter sp. TaxID=66852 RepID=UPI0025F52A00|nr:hypothetical protein [Methanobrevibacter sp.]MBR4448556.1 hypothetical protein [Methanobrevibacter sp.]